MSSILPITGDTNFHHWVKVVSTRSLLYKVSILLVMINTYLAGRWLENM